MASLELRSGTRRGELFFLTKQRVIIGRHPACDIIVDASAVSRQHVAVSQDGSLFCIEDLRSRNGTSVNGQSLSGKRTLTDGDEVLICDHRFRFALQPTVASLSPAAEDSSVGSETGAVEDLLESSDHDSLIVSQVEIPRPSDDKNLSVHSEAKLRAMIGLSRAIGASLSLDEVLPKLLDGLSEIFPQTQRGFVLLSDPNSNRMVLRAKKLLGLSEPGPLRLSLSLIDKVVQSRHAILLADATSDSRFKASDSVVDYRMRSVMCAPFIGSGGSVLGVLHVDTLDASNSFCGSDLEILAGIAGLAAQAIEQALAHDASVGQEHLKRDLELAHRVQQGLLPSKPPDVNGYQLFDFYEPAQQIGGDFFGYVPVANGCMAVVLADVSGKGVSAALVMAALSADVRYCLASECNAGAAVSRINESFCRSGWDDRFATLIVAVIDPLNHTLTLVSAGHLPAFLRNTSGDVQAIGSEQAGLPLGVDPEYIYETLQIPMPPGATLVLYTDGISEAMDHENRCYGLARLKATLSSPATTVAEIGGRILSDVERHAAGQVRSDDMCLVCVKRSELQPAN